MITRSKRSLPSAPDATMCAWVGLAVQLYPLAGQTSAAPNTSGSIPARVAGSKQQASGPAMLLDDPVRPLRCCARISEARLLPVLARSGYGHAPTRARAPFSFPRLQGPRTSFFPALGAKQMTRNKQSSIVLHIEQPRPRLKKYRRSQPSPRIASGGC